MKTIVKFLALASTATAVSFGATTASATLMGLENITACVASGAASTPLKTCLDFNKFSANDGSGSFTANYANAKGVNVFTLTAGFGTDASGNDILTLTFQNLAAQEIGLLQDSVMAFGGLAFAGGEVLTDVIPMSLISEKAKTVIDPVTGQPTNPTGDVSQFLPQMFDGPTKIAETSDGFLLDFSNGAKPVPGKDTVTLTAMLVKVPEPGSLALLGAVLVAFGAIQIRRRAIR